MMMMVNFIEFISINFKFILLLSIYVYGEYESEISYHP